MGKLREHDLKIWPSYFEAVKSGVKTFEWRRNDRDFAVGDILRLQEFEPAGSTTFGGVYTGRELFAEITYKAEGVFGIPEGYCVLAIKPIIEEPQNDT